MCVPLFLRSRVCLLFLRFFLPVSFVCVYIYMSSSVGSDSLDKDSCMETCIACVLFFVGESIVQVCQFCRSRQLSSRAFVSFCCGLEGSENLQPNRTFRWKSPNRGVGGRGVCVWGGGGGVFVIETTVKQQRRRPVGSIKSF